MGRVKRTQKFYSENEKKTMRSLGLKPTLASGAGWIEKEDGHNDYVIAQHKSTDAESYRLCQSDLRKLEYHALIDKKIPLFVVEFLNNGEIYLIVKPGDIMAIVNYIELPNGASEVKSEPTIDVIKSLEEPTRQMVKSGNKKVKEELKREREERYSKKKV